MKNYKNLNSEDWSKLDKNERLKALQELENDMAALTGRRRREVYPTTLSPNDLGVYNDQHPQYLFIDRKLINYFTWRLENYFAINTVLHEGRHAFQADIAFGRLRCPAGMELLKDKWRKNYAAYIKPEESMPTYFFQPIERDAFNFASTQMKELYPLIHEVTGHDSGADMYEKESSAKFRDQALQATLLYGEDFEQEIDQIIEERFLHANKRKPRFGLWSHVSKETLKLLDSYEEMAKAVDVTPEQVRAAYLEDAANGPIGDVLQQLVIAVQDAELKLCQESVQMSTEERVR